MNLPDSADRARRCESHNLYGYEVRVGLADEFARHMRFNDDDDTIGWLEGHKERILAALRVIESVRAFSPVRFGSDDYEDGYRDGVEAVQALLKSDR